MSRVAVCCCLLLGGVAVVTCGSDSEAPDRSVDPLSLADRPALARTVEEPAGWRCHRYGDVTDEDGDSYDVRAAREAERYLVDSVTASLQSRGIEPEIEEVPPARWSGLLSEICVEWPDLVLEAAVGRVAEGLP